MSLRISEFKKPKSIIVDQAKIDSAYGPKSSILLETSASSHSQSGFTIEVKGVSRDSLLSGLFVNIPIQVRWTGCSGGRLLLNQYANLEGRPITAFVTDAAVNKVKLNEALFYFDNVCVRPNAFKCIRNATLSINGSSFSTRTDAYYTAMCKLFADGRKEDISGCAYESYPYNNCGDKTRKDYQRGWYERCKAMDTMGQIKSVKYADADGKTVTDLVMEYNIKFPLWFGPYTHLGFPGLTGFDGQTVAALPYCNDLVLECTFSDDPLMDMFACADPAHGNMLGLQNPSWLARAQAYQTDFSPDTKTMWASFVAGDLTAATNSAKLVGLQPPKLCYQFSEPDHDKMEVSPLYTIPSYRLITYEDRMGWPASSYGAPVRTVRVKFPFIRLSNISSLYICMAECDRIDSGASIGYRQGRGTGADYSGGKLGCATANRTLPIKWDTVKVSMSTQSQVLTNFTANTITAQSQFELFKKYSGDAMGLSFEAWEESSQMLLFSAEELCGIGAFANSFQSLTMSIEFDVYRPAVDTKVEIDDYLVNGDASRIKNKNKGYGTQPSIVGRLICLEPELVSISEGALSVEQVKLSQQEIHNQLMGGAPEIEDANRLDQLAR